MFEFGVLEVIGLAVWFTGIAISVVGIALRRLTAQSAMTAVLLSVVIPVLGSVAAIVIVITRWRQTELPRVGQP
jgi:uncharacterized membrane protein YhaH (DUF805 family)